MRDPLLHRRRTYIVSDGVRWAREYGASSAWVRSVIIRDLENLARGIGLLGDDIDEREWRAVLAELKPLDAGVQVDSEVCDAQI